jgi:hypothetical protein
MVRCERGIGITVYRHWRSSLFDDELQINSRVEMGKYSDHLSVIVFGGSSYARAKIDNRKQDVRSSLGQQVEQRCNYAVQVFTACLAQRW